MIDVIEIILLLGIGGYLLLNKQHAGKMPIKTGKRRRLILDTCGLIDGRIIELTNSGFVPEELVVPDFVLHELQMLADGADAHKRERARYGLDVVKELQASTNAVVTIDHMQHARQPNDDKLIDLALRLKAPLYTTDYNLSKLAEIKGVTVLNVNELAQHLRPLALPGEHKTVKILQKGSNAKQGVGYLEDGTMVVVDGASRLVGKSLEVEITRTHQTVAGKMLFGVPIDAPSVNVQKQQPRQAPQAPQSPLAARLRKPRKMVKTIGN